MDWCADAAAKGTPSHRSQCGGFVVSQNSNPQSSHAHARCRLLLFILLTINDCSNNRISAPCSVAKSDEAEYRYFVGETSVIMGHK